MKLSVKFSVLVSLLIMAVILSIGSLIYISEKKFLIKESGQSRFAAAKNFAKVCEESLALRDHVFIINYSGMIQRTNPGIEFSFFMDKTGTMLTAQEEAALAVLKGKNDYVLSIDKQTGVKYNSPDGSEVYTIIIPLSLDGVRAGSAAVGFSQNELDKEVERALQEVSRRILKTGVIVLALGIIAALILALTVTKPIEKLAIGARMIGEGKLDTRIEINSKNEIGMLAEEFNNMSVRLHELDELKSDFINTVSHELRSPLSYIKGYVDLYRVESEDKLTQEQLEYFDVIEKNISRLTHFVNDILDLAKIEARQIVIKSKECDIGDIVKEMMTLCKTSVDEKNITLDYEILSSSYGEIPAVMVDEDKIKNVIVNLVNNALKFTPDGGKIRIIAAYGDVKWHPASGKMSSVEKGFVRVSVEDNGAGMPSEILDSIFDKFKQVESDGKAVNSVKGTGLGLAIARGIVKAHGGKIWVDSELDKGTVFSFTVPLARDQESS